MTQKAPDSTSDSDSRPVFFFDIDNCLYPRSYKIIDMMRVLINKYFREQLQLTQSDADHLHHTYYTSYGLALEGLVRHHQIDPLDYNAKVDDALPLESVIRPVPGLRDLLTGLQRAGKVRLWLLTNAYVNHGKRVVRLLGIEDCFEGITYCDYAQEQLVCKPKREMYEKAMAEAGITNRKACYFVDDSYINCVGASKFGWEMTVHLLDPSDPEPETPASKYQIRDLEELRRIFPEIFEGGEE